MKTFKDAKEREWTIDITLGTALAIKNALGVDLLQPELGEPPLADRLVQDELLRGQIIAEILKPQFRKRGISENEIYATFDASTLTASESAFYEAFVDFFHRRGQDSRAKLIETNLQLVKTADQVLVDKLSLIDIAKRKAAMEDAVDATFGKWYGNQEESSESIPSPSLSDN